MDSAEISALFADLDRELWLITAQAGHRRGGLIATFVSQASIVPELPRVLVGVARQHHTWQLIEQAEAFALHLLGEEHLPLVWRFGLQSGRQSDKLDGLSIHAGKTGSPIWAAAPAWLEARVEAKLETGDRTLYLAEVLEGRWQCHAHPLTVQHMVQQAPPDKLQQLKGQMERDQAVDAAAIRAWRQGRSRVQTHVGFGY
jgi:flavin reductase (DIM6/NTAB) family NADH-FMN oxidoreductase RutF